MDYAALLTRFSVVAGLLGGCTAAEQRAFDKFAEKEADLHCDIAEICGEESLWACDPPRTHDFDRCDQFLDDEADTCLDSLREALEAVENASPADLEMLCSSVFLSLDCFNIVQDHSPVAGGGCAIDGRPLRHGDGSPALCSVTRGQSWASEGSVDLTDWTLDPTGREAAAEHWLRSARYEHASVATFAKLTLDLLAHGAPADLVEQAQRAASDEIRHAKLCLGLARSLGRREWDLGALPLPALDPPGLKELALEALHDGAIGETTAALVALRGARAASPVVARVQRDLHEDELRHADLAWATIRWALQRDPSLAPTLLASLTRRTSDPSTSPAIPEAGVVDGGTVQAIEAEVVREIVRPLLRAMVSSSQTRRDRPHRPVSAGGPASPG